MGSTQQATGHAVILFSARKQPHSQQQPASRRTCEARRHAQDNAKALTQCGKLQARQESRDKANSAGEGGRSSGPSERRSERRKKAKGSMQSDALRLGDRLKTKDVIKVRRKAQSKAKQSTGRTITGTCRPLMFMAPPAARPPSRLVRCALFRFGWSASGGGSRLPVRARRTRRNPKP